MRRGLSYDEMIADKRICILMGRRDRYKENLERFRQEEQETFESFTVIRIFLNFLYPSVRLSEGPF
jgi:hypothetical protein